MANSYTMALVGFAQQEATTFESFFRLAARRPPSYLVQDEVLDAQLLIVNADNMQAVHLVRYAELPGRVLLVGNSDAGTGWPLQRKPVRLVGVLAALDALVGIGGAQASVPSAPASREDPYAPPVAARQGADRGFAATEPFNSQHLPLLKPKGGGRRKSGDTEFPPTRPMEDHRPAAAAAAELAERSAPPPQSSSRQQARVGVMGVTDFGGLDELPMPPSTPPAAGPRAQRSRLGQTRSSADVPELPHGDMLLVAESLVEGRILHKRFKRYGLNIDWSRDSKQAVAMLKAHVYRLVVIDRLTGEPDAYQVCRNAKQGRLLNGQSPVVVMFAAAAGSMDRIKASLAGSDAYLTRSVGEAELYKVLEKHRLVNLDGFEATNVGF